MSRRSERKMRRKEKLKSDIRTSLIVSLVGLVFFVLGLAGVLLNQRQLKEYQNTEKLVSVPAEITYAEIKSDKDEDGRQIDVYDAKLAFSVDGKDYTGKKRFDEPVQKGDIRSIEVYRTSSGDYRIPEIRNETDLLAKNVIMMFGIAAGAVLVSAGLFSVLRTLRELKK